MIHRFKAGDLFILLDVNSGGVHLVDELSYELSGELEPYLNRDASIGDVANASECPKEILDKFSEKYNKDEIIESFEEIKKLTEDGMLYTADQYENYANTAVNSPIKSMCLHISHDCNLRCKYCFASTGDFGTGRKLMPFEIGKAAIDFLLERSTGRPNLEVDFFGGEPMINFEVVKQVVEYARSKEKEYEKNFRFTITTNGMIMTDDQVKYINENMANVVLSIDGRKEINDRMRPRVDGSGSYDRIVKNFKKLVADRGDKEYYVRGTYTRYNLDFTEDILSLYNEGFDQISVEPVMEDPTMDYAITEKDLDRIYEEYDRLMEEIGAIKDSGRFINFFHFMIDLNQGPCIIKRLRGCGSGNEYISVTPDGDIYPCHQFVGKDEFKMGSVLDKTLDEDIKKLFSKAHVYSKPKCKNCWAKYYCSGGCNANNYNFNHDILDSYDVACGIQKKRLEAAIIMKIRDMLKEEA
ncbi:MAG: thioether cross-link-forming SCIFF peptide maturase [Lachnospiraceae bacterium]|nr:thioether cross-link-forming SCIFF peptide maturase [Lachnospiraceae bacterium]